ncbi:MAG: hypothetical protein GY740_04495, partial [Gammaproteobacteria bacterium]|nr:hypothetical protein [Gammaproteobacteria bacterium]
MHMTPSTSQTPQQYPSPGQGQQQQQSSGGQRRRHSFSRPELQGTGQFPQTQGQARQSFKEQLDKSGLPSLFKQMGNVPMFTVAPPIPEAAGTSKSTADPNATQQFEHLTPKSGTNFGRFYDTKYPNPIYKKIPLLPNIRSIPVMQHANDPLPPHLFKAWPEGQDLAQFPPTVQSYYYHYDKSKTIVKGYGIQLNKAP